MCLPYHGDGVPVASAVSLSSPTAATAANTRCRCRCSCSPDCCLVYLRCHCRTQLSDRVLTVARRGISCQRCGLAASTTTTTTVIATSCTSPASDYFPLSTDYRCTRALLSTCLRLLTHLFRLGVGRIVLFLLLLFWRISLTAAQYHTQPPSSSSPIGLSMRTRLPEPDSTGGGRAPSTLWTRSHHLSLADSRSSRIDLPECSGRSEHHLTPDLIRFVCTRLPHPCDRAAYLRSYARHSLCSKLPVLFLLPLTNRSGGNGNAEPGKCGDSAWTPPFLGIELQRQTWDSLYLSHLQPTDECVQRLTGLLRNITQLIAHHFTMFDDLVKKSYCKNGCSGDDEIVTGEFKCQVCEVAYTDWLCASLLSVYLPFPVERGQLEAGGVGTTSAPAKAPPPSQHPISASTNSGPSSVPSRPVASVASVNGSGSSSRSSRSIRMSTTGLYRLQAVQQCSSWCTKVEKVCPYFNAVDDTSNGGEPAFLCHESHYHHSPLYNRQLYETGQCVDACCYTDVDLRLLTSTSGASALSEDWPAPATRRNLSSRCSQPPQPLPRGSCEGVLGEGVCNGSSVRVSNSASSSGLSCWLTSVLLVWLVVTAVGAAVETLTLTRARPRVIPNVAAAVCRDRVHV